MDIVTLSEKRYTAKAYDATKKIPDKQFQQLCTLLQNCPSSVNSQPWHFIVAQTDESKAQILDCFAKFNHARVTDASHVIIFCARTDITDQHLRNLLEQEQKDGRLADEQAKKVQDAGRRHFVGLNNRAPLGLLAWESKQIYLALGALLFGAASLGIDSTPLEGFDTAKLDATLGLAEKGLTSVVVASLGYHSADDFNANLPKSRLPQDQLFTFL